MALSELAVEMQRFFISIHAAGNADRKRKISEPTKQRRIGRRPRKATVAQRKGFKTNPDGLVVKITSQTGGNDNIVDDALRLVYLRDREKKGERERGEERGNRQRREGAKERVEEQEKSEAKEGERGRNFRDHRRPQKNNNKMGEDAIAENGRGAIIECIGK